MKCPVCREPDLVMSGRQGIEIGYCPSCRGVWLDRGELDKLIERGSASDSYRDEEEHAGRRGKRRGFLGELFDFD